MPYSIKIPLQTVVNPNPEKLFGFGHTNRALLAIVLKWLGDQGVHTKQLREDLIGLQPYTISPLINEGRKRASFRITLLNDFLWEPLEKAIRKEHLISIGPSSLSIDQDQMKIDYSDYSEIAKARSNDQSIILDFLSPTTFRSKGTNYPLPDPNMVFRSLLTKWNSFSANLFQVDVSWLDWLKISVRIGHVYQSTQAVQVTEHDHTETGFLGQIQYRIIGKVNSDECKIANMLADFSYYSGVGAKTTHGMGQTQRIRKITEKPMIHYPSETPSKSRLFISYSSKDSETVNKLAKSLQKVGFDIWLDQKDIVIGQPILDRIRDGVTKESDYVLIILSRNSTVSEWCKLELRMAYEKELTAKRIVVLPIRIDDTDVPDEVKTKKYFQLEITDKGSVKLLIDQIRSVENM